MITLMLYDNIDDYIQRYYNDNGIFPSPEFIKDNKDLVFSLETSSAISEEFLISTLYNEYVNKQEGKGFKKSTLNIYQFTLDKWLEYSNGKYLFVIQMNLDVLENFRNYLFKKGLKENTVGKYIKTIKSFLNYCYYQKEITEIPISYKKIIVDKEYGTEIVHLTKDELEQVKKEVFYSGWYGNAEMNLTDREKLIGQIFVFLCSTGFSYVDFTNLRLHHIQVETNRLENDKYVTIEISRQKLKTIHKSIIPIVDVTIDILLEWVAIDRDFYSYDQVTLKQKKKKKLNQAPKLKITVLYKVIPNIQMRLVVQ